MANGKGTQHVSYYVDLTSSIGTRPRWICSHPCRCLVFKVSPAGKQPGCAANIKAENARLHIEPITGYSGSYQAPGCGLHSMSSGWTSVVNMMSQPSTPTQAWPCVGWTGRFRSVDKTLPNSLLISLIARRHACKRPDELK